MPRPLIDLRRCVGITRSGERCRRRAWADENGYICFQHEEQDGTEEDAR